MLQKFMDMGVFIYTMTGIGVAGILMMFLMNAISKKTIRDKSTYNRVVNRMKKVTITASVLCLGVVAASMGITFSVGQVQTTGIRHLITGFGSIFLMICSGRLLSYLDRQRLFNDYMFEMIDRQNGTAAVAAAEQSLTAEHPQEKVKTRKFFMKKTPSKKAAAAKTTDKKFFAQKNTGKKEFFAKNSAKNNVKNGLFRSDRAGRSGKNSTVTGKTAPEPTPENVMPGDISMEKSLTLFPKDQLVDKALRGIRESAASGENRFSHILSDEEEDIMREVIGEFIAQG